MPSEAEADECAKFAVITRLYAVLFPQKAHPHPSRFARHLPHLGEGFKMRLLSVDLLSFVTKINHHLQTSPLKPHVSLSSSPHKKLTILAQLFVRRTFDACEPNIRGAGGGDLCMVYRQLFTLEIARTAYGD